MIGWLLRLVKALLESLYMLFEGKPALEALRSWFEEHTGKGSIDETSLILIAAAAVLGFIGFLGFYLFIRKSPRLVEARPEGEE